MGASFVERGTRVGKKERSKIWAWDIEAEEWDRPTCVVAKSNAGDVERFQGPGCLASMGDVIEKAKGTWVAHAGGIYDTVLYTQIRDKPWQEIILAGSAMLCARDGTLRMRDSYRAWLAPLKKVGEYLDKLEQARDVPRHPPGYWHKKDVDRSRMAEMTPEEQLEYCESDTSILLEGVLTCQAYLESHGARVAWTAGASALALMEALEPATWRTMARHTLDLDTAIQAQACVRGARVETWAMGRVPRVYVYDFKSAYPASYMDDPVGFGAVHLDANDADRPGAVWRCRWFWPWRDRIPPATDALTGSGAGWCEAWLVEEEIQLFHDVEVNVTRLEGWAPEVMYPWGQKFARVLYAEKEAGSFFGKVFLNGNHGKAGESPIKTTWTRDRPSTWYARDPELMGDYWRALKADVDGDGRCRRHVQPLTAAHILGRQRAREYRAIRDVVEAGGEVYYGDTDSIHCNLPPEHMPMKLGKELGQLDFEGGPFVGIYLAPKAYCLIPVNGGKIKGALKGMPWGLMADAVCQDDGPRGRPLYRQARDREIGSDRRVEVFTRALAEPGGVELLKEGIRSFVGGVRHKEGWAREALPRTLTPQGRGKAWRGDLGAEPTTWAYLTPSETLARRDREYAHLPASLEAEDIETQGELDTGW